MSVEEIRKSLTMLKLHIDQVDDWVRQASNMIYDIEEGLFDIEDKDSKKYETEDNIEFLKEAATGIYQMFDSPPRLKPSHCDKDNIVAAGFYQSNFELKKII